MGRGMIGFISVRLMRSTLSRLGRRVGGFCHDGKMRRTAGIPVEHGLSARFAVRRSEVGENISGQKMQGKRHVVLHCGEQHGAIGRALTRMDAKELRQPE
ncbi:hypothetical protein F152LOC_03771 [Pectobacterium brasiliense]|nr:hypothetical protein F152LOC_03771 [Pectobacterium brasiliense]